MNRTAKTLVIIAGAAVLALSSGCRVERTTGQRHQARAVDSVLRAESMRLNDAPMSETTLEDYAHLNAMYQDLLHAAIRSGEMRSRVARTGAPARARIVLQPTVRSIVLLPDIFEPLITSP